MPLAPQPSATVPLIRKLGHYARLSTDDCAALERLCAHGLHSYRARDDILLMGDEPRVLRLVVDGWACRYNQLEDGRRQVLGLFLPGDLCDLHAFVLREMDHFVGAITPVTVAQIPREVFEEVTLAHPRLLQALWWDALVSAAIHREWLMNLGSRTAYERIAHLMCELYLRQRAAGRTEGLSCEFPLTQTLIADITGLSTVHVSRTFQVVREERLVEIRDRVLTIRDLDALKSAALFNPCYLHLDREGRHLDAPPGDEMPFLRARG